MDNNESNNTKIKPIRCLDDLKETINLLKNQKSKKFENICDGIAALKKYGDKKCH